MAYEYEKGYIRTDRGLFIDKGNYGVDPRHEDFAGGAQFDGTTDDTRQIKAAITFAISQGKPLLWPGSAVVSSTLTDSAGRLTIQAFGRRNSVLRWNGSEDDWVLSFVSHKSELAGGMLILGHTSAKDYLWNGIKCSSSASRVMIPNEVEIYRPKNGLKLTTVYGCQMRLDVSEVAEIGIDFDGGDGITDTGANANSIVCATLSGKTTTFGTTGVRNTGHRNYVYSQQASSWTTFWSAGKHSEGVFEGYAEVNDKNVDGVEPYAVTWRANGYTGNFACTDGAIIR